MVSRASPTLSRPSWTVSGARVSGAPPEKRCSAGLSSARRYDLRPVAPNRSGERVGERLGAAGGRGERRHDLLRLVARVGEPGAEAERRVVDLPELELGRVEVLAGRGDRADERAQRLDVDLVALQEGRVLADHRRPGLDRDLCRRGEPVERVAEVAHVGDRAADDRDQAPHVAADALHRALHLVGVPPRARHARRRGVEVARLQGRARRLEVGLRVLRAGGRLAERQRQQDQHDEQQEQAADDGGRPDQPSRGRATGGRHAPIVPNGAEPRERIPGPRVAPCVESSWPAGPARGCTRSPRESASSWSRSTTSR